jgi:hypothetical protein
MSGRKKQKDLDDGKLTGKNKFRKISRLIVSISNLKSSSSGKENGDKFDSREEIMEMVS